MEWEVQNAGVQSTQTTGARYLASGSILIDRERRLLTIADIKSHLSRRSFILLEALMLRPRQLLPKSEIFDIVWHEAVSDSALTTAVKEIRRCLKDDARNPRLIETVHGQGYRFLQTVEEEDCPFEDMEPTVGSQFRSVAVFPFEDYSSSQDQIWLACGITEEVLTSLARAPDLIVISGKLPQGASDEEARSAAQLHNVAHLLRGSVRRDKAKIRFTARLIRVADGLHIWSESFDCPSADLIAVQEGVAVNVARALQTFLSRKKLEEMVALGTRSVPAYEEYLKGRALEREMLEAGNVGLMPMTLAAFERARVIDPNFAEAHWYAAGYQNRSPFVLGPPNSKRENDRFSEILSRLDLAIKSSEDRPESIKYRAERERLCFDLRKAMIDICNFVELRPRDQNGWELMARLAGYLGDYGLMLRASRQLEKLDRRHSGYYGSGAITYAVLAGYPYEAVEFGRRQLSTRPNDPVVGYQLHRAYLYSNCPDDARILVTNLKSSALPIDLVLLAGLRQACAEEDDERAMDLYRQIQNLRQSSLIARWESALLVQDTPRSIDIVRPFDTVSGIRGILDFLTYPWFDVSSCPYMQDQLRINGIERRQPFRDLPLTRNLAEKSTRRQMPMEK